MGNILTQKVKSTGLTAYLPCISNAAVNIPMGNCMYWYPVGQLPIPLGPWGGGREGGVGLVSEDRERPLPVTTARPVSPPSQAMGRMGEGGGGGSSGH